VHFKDQGTKINLQDLLHSIVSAIKTQDQEECQKELDMLYGHIRGLFAGEDYRNLFSIWLKKYKVGLSLLGITFPHEDERIYDVYAVYKESSPALRYKEINRSVYFNKDGIVMHDDHTVADDSWMTSSPRAAIVGTAIAVAPGPGDE
jgi:hypothetical protein